MLIGGFRVALAEALSRKRRPPEKTVTDEVWRFVVGGVRFIESAEPV